MKYDDFYNYLVLRVNNTAHIGPDISIKLGEDPKISISKFKGFTNRRYAIFPIKIYGETIRHINILILDRKTKIMERYEPFDQYLNFHQINDLLESLLYKLMSQKRLYFLKYQTTLNTEAVLNNNNCGLYCVKYVMDKIKDGLQV